ncbi:MAG: histidinol-phosphatase [Planctomycetales bacterium]|nr:histidinol-phosphatase [Planctomycetales bacterium]
MADDIEQRLQLAVEVAREAGEITLEHYQSASLRVESKADESPVTAADRAAETRLRERIAARFPHDAIVGEEFGEQPGSSGYQWVLDPIDGTKSFICGVPLYGTLVGVAMEDGEGVAGVIHIPALDEMVYAARGKGAWYVQRGAAAVRASTSRRSLEDGLFLTTDERAFGKLQANGEAAYRQLASAARLTRTWGDCYGYLAVAVGRAELMVDPALHVWDAAALQPVLEEAGGHFVDWRGEPTIRGGDGIGAANRQVLEAALAACRGK